MTIEDGHAADVPPVKAIPEPDTSFHELMRKEPGTMFDVLMMEDPVDEYPDDYIDGIGSYAEPAIRRLVSPYCTDEKDTVNEAQVEALVERYRQVREVANSFTALFRQNDGVLLEPLASGKSPSEYPEDWRLGIGEVSRRAVRRLASTGEGGYSLDKAEEDRLLERHRHFQVAAVLIRRRQTQGAVESDVAPKPKEQNDNGHQSPLEARIEETIFADPLKPDVEGIAHVVQKRPTSYTLMDTIEEAFSDHGYTLYTRRADGGKTDLTRIGLDVVRAAARAYDRFLFTDRRAHDYDELLKVVKDWTVNLSAASSPISQTVSLNVIKVAVKDLVGCNIRRFEDLTGVLETLEASLVELGQQPNVTVTGPFEIAKELGEDICEAMSVLPRSWVRQAVARLQARPMKKRHSGEGVQGMKLNLGWDDFGNLKCQVNANYSVAPGIIRPA